MAIRRKPEQGSLGQRIRALRGGQSRDQFAGELGIHRNTLARYESGQRMPDAGMLRRLCRVARVPPEWLLEGVEPEDGAFVEPELLGDLEGLAPLRLNRGWLRQVRLDPDNLCLYPVPDDAMVPTLRPGELLLVDRGDPLPPANGSLVVVWREGHYLARRVRRVAGRLELGCDNPAHPSMVLDETGLQPGGACELVGRVRRQLRSVGGA